MKKSLTHAAALAALITLLPAASGDHHRSKQSGAKDVVDTAVAAGQFETLVAAVKAAGLVETLKGDGPFTVFAPTDEAFAKLPDGTLEMLLKPENKAKLTAILTYHVVAEKLPASKVTTAGGATTVNGQRVDFKAAGGKVMVDSASVAKADIGCSNGVIHVIDTVILPAESNIVETADAAGSFGTLLTAAKAAGIADVLATGGPFTVFAPTDEAFAKLPTGTLEDLLKPQNKQKLATILKYHVLEGRVYSPSAASTGDANTLAGESVRFSRSGDDLRINEANIVKTDIDASNGVIHVIDRVILPK